MAPFQREQLEELKRRDLQALCKKYDIKCAGKNAELIEKLLELGTESILNPELSDVMETVQSNAEESVEVEQLEAENVKFSESVDPPVMEILSEVISKPVIAASSIPRPLYTKPIPTGNSATTITAPLSTKPLMPVVSSTTSITSTSAAVSKKKFDLKESLKRPLGYKPHSG